MCIWQREKVYECKWVSKEKEKKCLCVCVCVCVERERERQSVYVQISVREKGKREDMLVKERVCVYWVFV